MNKRLSKKVHKKYLVDVVYDISTSSLWRERIFQSDYGVKIEITFAERAKLSKYLKYAFSRYKLHYNVSKVEGDISERDFYYEGGVYFKFEAAKFNDIYDYSFNNTAVI